MEQDKAEREMVLTEFIPYLKQHCNLSAMEQTATAALREGQNISPEQAAYYNAVVAYVQDCRPLLNQGQYNLPEPPKLADFDQSLQDYKAQVQAEIAQEAAAAGMTVEEYAAAGFEAPQRLRIHYNCVGTIEIPSALPLPTPDVSVNTRKGVVVNYAPCDVAI